MIIDRAAWQTRSLPPGEVLHPVSTAASRGGGALSRNAVDTGAAELSSALGAGTKGYRCVLSGSRGGDVDGAATQPVTFATSLRFTTGPSVSSNSRRVGAPSGPKKSVPT